jgi:hypothetical protein
MERVIFRKWRRGERDVIALFPGIDEGRGLCRSYMHVGQHGAADYMHVVRLTTPAQPAEYSDLAAELRERGYDLDIRQRRPS